MKRVLYLASATAIVFVMVVPAGAGVPAAHSTTEAAPRVIAPPDAFFELVRPQHRQAARDFYKKYIDVGGMPVVAAAEVADLALQRTHQIVTHLLAGRPDVIRAMVDGGMYLIIIGKDQVYTDMPEYRGHPNPAYQNERVRGTGGQRRPASARKTCSACRSIATTTRASACTNSATRSTRALARHRPDVARAPQRRLRRRPSQRAFGKTPTPASNPAEYWAEICQSYFDCNRVNNWNHGPIGTREQLKRLRSRRLRAGPYDFPPERPTTTGGTRPCSRSRASSRRPPEFKLDPYYTKFTWAREFTVLGRGASDAALLKTNDTIRKLFAYRHDILKALMADGVKLVVLGPEEKIADLPEYKALADKSAIDVTTRTLGYSPALKLLVVDAANVLADPRHRNVGDNQIIRVLADAIYTVAGTRPSIRTGKSGLATFGSNMSSACSGSTSAWTTLSKICAPRRCWRANGKAHPLSTTGQATGPRACSPISMPPARTPPRPMQTTRLPPASGSNNTTPISTSSSTKRSPTAAKSIGDSGPN